MKNLLIVLVFILFLINVKSDLLACTNLLVTKGATKDGSVIITYTCDGEFHPHLRYLPATDYSAKDSLELRDWSGKLRGKIPQVEHTYSVVHLMNEHQLAIGETTFSGREELQNKKGLLHYWDLMKLALQRAKTAREAILVIADLVEKYGYRSTGESFSIGDKNEAWIMEMIGPGEDGTGAVWVAVKVPDGYIAAHANKAVIGEFPLNDKKNCLYSKNVIKLAIEKGYYNPKKDGKFKFNEVYCPSTPKNKRYASARVWSLFRRVAPSLKLSSDYHRGVEGAKPYPLWVKPDKKIDVKKVFSLMRDHYEGTDFDMTKGVDAGPYGTPNRWRDIYWKVDGQEYMWERPISTQQTGFSFVSQSRSFLPDEVGGVLWYGVDDTYFSCYFPLYCSINQLPESYTYGSLRQFSWNSAFWVFNFVANFANLKYEYMKPDIQAVQNELEGNLLAIQPAVEETAKKLAKKNPQLVVKYLTDYSIYHAEMTTKKWKQLGEYLIRKYNDGYVQEKPGRPEEKGYSQEWLRRVLKDRPEQFKLKKKNDKLPESKLVD